MQHRIHVTDVGAHGAAMAHAVEACVHCGFCLPACPTYQVLGQEMDSPRGRILLMKEVLEGNVALDEATPYVDRCLGCLGCVTACPSGVQYGELLTPFRAWAEPQRRRSAGNRLFRRLLLATLPFPRRFRWALRAGGAVRPWRRWLPRRWRTMLDLLPARLPAADPLPEVYPAEGPRRARVALLTGCAQQVLAPEINRATLRVLAGQGVEVVIPRGQVCCGALAAHTGALTQAARLAKQNLAAFPKDVDAVVTNAAGCGSGMQEYGLWLAGEDQAAEAQTLAARVLDVSKFLAQLGTIGTGVLEQPLAVAYHDACHLAHAQGVRSEPRRLLSAIENLRLQEIPDGELCCGSAGSYNLEQPETAWQLGCRKAEAIAATGAELVVTGNIGCLMQLRTHLAGHAPAIPALHTIQLLDQAYGRGSSRRQRGG